MFPSFSVTIHSFTRLASRSPIIAALVRWRDMTFSKRIQKTTRCKDLAQARGHALVYLFNRLNWIKRSNWNDYALPGSADSIQKSNSGRNINCNRFRELNFWNQDTHWYNYTIEEESYPVSNNLPHKEECIDDMKSLPYRYPLQK